MEQRLSLVTLGVRDLARSRAFYETLGWHTACPPGESVAFFQMPGMIFSLYGREPLAADAGVTAEGSGFAGIALAWNGRSKDEVDAAIASFVAAGGRLFRPAHDAFWGGYSGYVADPDGHLWEIAWNPSFPIAEDGAVRLPD